MIDIVVPNLGESITEATVASWLKRPGDPVAADETLLEQLERRQNQVIQELDALDQQIAQLMNHWQNSRQ